MLIMGNLFDCYRNLKRDVEYYFINRGKIQVKGLGLRTTYFVERCDSTQTEVKTLGQRTSVSHRSLFPPSTRTSEQIYHCRKSTSSVTAITQTGSTSMGTNLWTAPTFSTHIAPSMHDNLPIAS
jgi:hypothetical protein